MLRITLSARAADEAIVETLLAASEQDIAAGVGAAGYAVRRESSPE
jgi:hypothetical protein